MAATPGATGTNALVAQAVSELHLGRLPEAQAALEQALQRDSDDVPALANSMVLNVVSGKTKEAADLQKQLEAKDAQHPLLLELEEKGKAFDEASKKYSAKVAS